MDFRVARPGDAEGIARAHVDGWQWGYRGLMPDDYLDSLVWADRVDRWSSTLDDPARTTTHVAVEDGVIHGLVHGGPVRDDDLLPDSFHEIYSLYVDRETAGTGVGATLLHLGIDGAAAHSPAVVVWVLAGNTRAKTFYARHGFDADGHSKDYEFGGATLSDVRMRRSR